jgi:hypothetical protein
MSFISTYSAASIRAWQFPAPLWEFESEITKPSSNANSQFGWSTAINEDGNYIVVGQRPNINNVEVLTIVSGPNFSNTITLSPSSYSPSAIGYAIDINNPGNIIAATDRTYGKLVIFNRSGNTWSETQSINANIQSAGTSCSINNDGDYIAISAGTNVLIYNNISNVWTLQQTLSIFTPPPTPAYCPVRLNSSGDYLAIGDIVAGSTKIFTRTGNTWTSQANITPYITPNAQPFFGQALDINDVANVLLVGAPIETVNGNIGAGSVYAYTRTGNTWTNIQTIIAPDSAAQQAFGGSISLDATGKYAIIGAYSFDGSGNLGNNQGKIYYFENINNVWQNIQNWQSPNISGSEFFGASASLSKNNSVAVIGAEGNDVPNNEVGAAYIYVNA